MKGNIRKYIIYVLFAIIIIYVIYAIYLLLKTPTETFTVKTGTLTKEESSTGYIIREETLLKGENYKNGLIQIASENERVSKKQVVFRYLASNEEEIKKKISEVDLKIQEALATNSTFSSADVKNIEKQIDKKVNNIDKLSDVQKISEIKKEISNLIVKKAKIVGELSSKGSYIKELTNEREEYEKQLTDGSEYVSATEAGLVSYRIDGLEKVLTPETIGELTEKKLEDLGLKTGKIIPVSTEESKIVNNFVLYIATVLDSENAKNAKNGDQVIVTLPSGREVKATIESTREQESGKILIILKTNYISDELLEYRKISLNITWWSKKGLKIPNNAIGENEDGVKFIVKEKAGTYSKVYIKVLKENDKYSIVENYKTDELSQMGIDTTKYTKVNENDMVLLYTDRNKKYN